MKRAVCALAIAMPICTATYETCHATAIAPLAGTQAGPNSVAVVYSYRYRHPYRIVVPLTRHYGYRTYWWPQGQYHWSPFGMERWGYWCEPAGPHRLSC
jgi:hypothetical protein